MNKNKLFWQFFGFIFVCIGGAILHFLFAWCNFSPWVAPFASVNESTFEHMKLLFFPAFIFALLQERFNKDVGNFWVVKLKGILIGLALIPTIFYTYSGCFGRSPSFLNIAIFFISVFFCFRFEAKNKAEKPKGSLLQTVAFAALCLIFFCFALFTYFPPRLPLFLDPVSNGYGIIKA